MTSRNTCKTCCYWGDEYDSDVRRCRKVPMYWDSYMWSDGGERVVKPGFEDQLAFVQDASDYRATLLTKAEFGCVHWRG